MQFVASLLIALFALLQIAASLEHSLRVSDKRILRYPPAAHPRDASSRVLGRGLDAAEVSNVQTSSATDNVLKSREVADECHAKDKNICAELIIGTSTVNQKIHLHDNGCTPVKNAAEITAINVFDCWCGLWNAADETACNNGDDEVVDQLNNCAGLKTRKERGWKKNPTHISCFRQT